MGWTLVHNSLGFHVCPIPYPENPTDLGECIPIHLKDMTKPGASDMCTEIFSSAGT